MTSALDTRPMCCICYGSIDPRDIYVDEKGDPWDFHWGICALETGRIPKKYAADYARLQTRMELVRKIDRHRYTTLSGYYQWIERTVLDMLENESFERRFRVYALRWDDETQLMSNASEMINNRWYRRIIGLGFRVIPLIIDELRVHPDWWFPALIELVGVDHAVGETTLDGAARRWIEWWDKWKSIG